jgi:hypothetical protein
VEEVNGIISDPGLLIKRAEGRESIYPYAMKEVIDGKLEYLLVVTSLTQSTKTLSGSINPNF